MNENSACTFHTRWDAWVKFRSKQKWLHKKRPIKTAWGFRKMFWDPYIELHGEAEMINWNRFETDCKTEWAIFTRCISFTGPLTQQSNTAFTSKVRTYSSTVSLPINQEWSAPLLGQLNFDVKEVLELLQILSSGIFGGRETELAVKFLVSRLLLMILWL